MVDWDDELPKRYYMAARTYEISHFVLKFLYRRIFCMGKGTK